MAESIFAEAESARLAGVMFAMATVVQADGSTPREAGARMLIYADCRVSGTIGGGKFEALVIAEAQSCLADGAARLREYVLREDEPESFGAICGGRVTVFIEPMGSRERLFVIGAGHCGAATARLAGECGLHVTLLDDRQPAADGRPPEETIGTAHWRATDALVIVNRNPDLDRAALAAALGLKPGPGYIGMIGSRRKVRRVFDELIAQGVSRESLDRVFAPIGLDIGSDSPMEIAVSVVAELLQILRRRKGGHLKL